jgi:hypothetical protein
MDKLTPLARETFEHLISQEKERANEEIKIAGGDKSRLLEDAELGWFQDISGWSFGEYLDRLEALEKEVLG